MAERLPNEIYAIIFTHYKRLLKQTYKRKLEEQVDIVTRNYDKLRKEIYRTRHDSFWMDQIEKTHKEYGECQNIHFIFHFTFVVVILVLILLLAIPLELDPCMFPRIHEVCCDL